MEKQIEIEAVYVAFVVWEYEASGKKWPLIYWVGCEIEHLLLNLWDGYLSILPLI